MSWNDTKFEGDLITHTDYNARTNALENISSNYYNHSSNRDIHFPSSQIRPWLNKKYYGSGSVLSHISAQSISGGTIIGDTITLGSHISTQTGLYAHFVSANNSNLSTGGSTTLAGEMEGNISGASYAYGLKDIDFVSSQAISGGTIQGVGYCGAEYIIYKDGSNYVAKDNKSGRKAYEGTSASSAINTAILNASGTTLVVDDIDLDGRVVGQGVGSTASNTKRVLDLGGHTVFPQDGWITDAGSDRRAGSMFTMAEGMTLRNGTIRTNKDINGNRVHFSGGVAILFDGASQYWVQAPLTTVNNIYIAGCKSGQAYNHGTGILYLCDGGGGTATTKNQAVYFTVVRDVKINFMNYGVHFKGTRNDSLTNGCDMQGNLIDGYYGNWSRYFIYMEHEHRTEYDAHINQNYFTNFCFQAGDSSQRMIYTDSKRNKFMGQLWDFGTQSKVSDTAIEIHPSGHSNYIETYLNVGDVPKIADSGQQTIINNYYNNDPNLDEAGFTTRSLSTGIIRAFPTETNSNFYGLKFYAHSSHTATPGAIEFYTRNADNDEDYRRLLLAHKTDYTLLQLGDTDSNQTFVEFMNDANKYRVGISTGEDYFIQMWNNNSSPTTKPFVIDGANSLVQDNTLYLMSGTGRGYVGINNDAPVYDLDVSGTVYAFTISGDKFYGHSITGAIDIDDGAGNGWDANAYENSGIKWNNTDHRWEPMPSGGSGGGSGSDPGGNAGNVQYKVDASTFGGEDAFDYVSDTNTLNLQGAFSSQAISGGSFKNIAFPADYVIDKTGDVYFVRDGSDGSVVKSSTSPSSCINYALQNTYMGEVYLATDVDNLDGVITSRTMSSNCLNLGGHMIKPDSSVSWPNDGFDIVRMKRGFHLKNGVIKVGDINFSGHSCVLFHGCNRFNVWYAADEETDTDDILSYSARITDMEFRGDKKAAVLNHSGTAILMQTEGNTEYVSHAWVQNVKTVGFKYGVRLKCYNSAGLGVAANSFINGNYFINYFSGFDKTPIYGDVEYPVTGLVTDVGANQFINYQAECRGYTERIIKWGGYNSYFQGHTWDTSNKAGTLVEFVSGSYGNIVIDNNGLIDKVVDSGNAFQGGNYAKNHAYAYDKNRHEPELRISDKDRMGDAIFTPSSITLRNGDDSNKGFTIHSRPGEIRMYGSWDSGDDVHFYSNSTDSQAQLSLIGGGDARLYGATNFDIDMFCGASKIATFDERGLDVLIGGVSSQKISSGTITNTDFITLTDGSNADSLHTHTAATSTGGPMNANIGANFDYGLSGLTYVSSQLISGGTIYTDKINMKSGATIDRLDGGRLLIQGGDTNTDDVYLEANSVDRYPRVLLAGGDQLYLEAKTGKGIRFREEGKYIGRLEGIGKITYFRGMNAVGSGLQFRATNDWGQPFIHMYSGAGTGPLVGVNTTTPNSLFDVNGALESNSISTQSLSSNSIRIGGLVSEIRSGWSQVSDGGTIAHGCSAKPNTISIAPSGTNPVAFSFKVDDTDITVYHTHGSAVDFSWRAEV